MVDVVPAVVDQLLQVHYLYIVEEMVRFKAICGPSFCCLSIFRRCYRRVVYISDDDIPHRNLAFEEWIYENVDLTKSSCLFMWRSKPTVVIGRHQNPWLESNLKYLRTNNIFLARRQTGGGTVFHDHGNLNVSFFTSRSSYDRKQNLQFVIDALSKTYKFLELSINERDDIVLDGKYKISGTAAKLGRCNAYHHFTLLMDSNLEGMSSALKSSLPNLNTKATVSVRSQTKNMSRYPGEISYHDIQDVLANHYLSIGAKSDERHIVRVDPTDNIIFRGISDIIEKLNSWEWIYAKSPKFVVDIPGVGQLMIVNGIIQDVHMAENPNPELLAQVSHHLIGTKFTYKDIESCLKSIETKSNIGKSHIFSAFHDILNSI